MAPDFATLYPGYRLQARRKLSVIPQQPLEVFELELRAEALAEAAAQLLEDAARAVHVDLPPHLDRGGVGAVAPARRPAERIGLLLRPRRPEPTGLAVGA